MWEQALPAVFTDGRTVSLGTVDRGRTRPERVALPWPPGSESATRIHLVAGPDGALTALCQFSSKLAALAARVAPDGSAVRELPVPSGPADRNMLYPVPGGPLMAVRVIGAIGASSTEVLVLDEPDEQWRILTTLESSVINWIGRGTGPGRLLLAGVTDRVSPDWVGLLAEVALDSGRLTPLPGPPENGRLRRRLFGPARPEEYGLAVAARGFVVAVEESGYFWSDRTLNAYSDGPNPWSAGRFRRREGVFAQELVTGDRALLLGSRNRIHTVDSARRRWSTTDLTRRLAATIGGSTERPAITDAVLHRGELWLAVSSTAQPGEFADCVIAVSPTNWSAELVHHCPAGERIVTLAQRPS